MPRFSIVVVHYQGVNPREVYLRGVNSLLAQTFKDFEVLVYHDGPLLDPEAPSPYPMRCTERRHKDWGHSLRDRGIREAKGDYILHFNADNVLYPDALEVLDVELRREPQIRNAKGEFVDTDNIVIFPIVMRNHQFYKEGLVRGPNNSGLSVVITGVPPAFGWIDCMQLVMKRSLWLEEGGWADRSANSDGRMYKRFGEKYGYRMVGKVLGEHY